jgi:RanGTP-binding protein
VPLISLALTTSGANLSSSLPDTVSPSRLLQASSLLRSADQYFDSHHEAVQVGPKFILKFYSIFTSHARVSSVKDIQWKEEHAKCHAMIVRIPSRAHREDEENRRISNDSIGRDFIDGYEYELRLIEDLDDGRYHEELENLSKKKINSIVAEKGYIEGHTRHIPVYKVISIPKFLT